MPKEEALGTKRTGLEDYHRNADILEYLKSVELVTNSTEVNEADYDTIARRSLYIIRNHPEISESTALNFAYFDCKAVREHRGSKFLDKIDQPKLSKLMEDMTGDPYTPEEIQELLQYLKDRGESDVPPTEAMLAWVHARTQAESSRNAAANNRGEVLQVGENAREVLREAIKESGKGRE